MMEIYPSHFIEILMNFNSHRLLNALVKVSDWLIFQLQESWFLNSLRTQIALHCGICGQNSWPRTTDTQWRHKLKISEKLSQCGRQNMPRLYLKIWDWIFGRAVKAFSSLCVRGPCSWPYSAQGLHSEKLVEIMLWVLAKLLKNSF